MAGGLNLYGYAGGDPINNSDPFGLCCFLPGGAVKSMVLNATAEVALRDVVRKSFLEPGTTVGGSVSLGLTTFSFAPGSGVTPSTNVVPQYGASVDVTMRGRDAKAGETVVTGAIGTSDHSGLSLSSTGDVGGSIGLGVSFKALPFNVAVTQNPVAAPERKVPDVVPDNTRVAPRPQS